MSDRRTKIAAPSQLTVHNPLVFAIDERVTVARAGIVTALPVSVQNPVSSFSSRYFDPMCCEQSRSWALVLRDVVGRHDCSLSLK